MTAIEGIQVYTRVLYGEDSFYSRHYAKEEQAYWGDIPQWIERLRESQSHNSPVVDVGPGYGTLLAYCALLGARTLVGIDRRFYICGDIVTRYGITMVDSDIEREDHYDKMSPPGLVIMTEVLEHFNFHPLPTLTRIRQNIAAHGVLMLSTPDAQSWGRVKLYSQLSDVPAFNPKVHSRDIPEWQDCHVWQYDRNELEVTLYKAGFDILRWGHTESSGGGHFQVMAIPKG